MTKLLVASFAAMVMGAQPQAPVPEKPGTIRGRVIALDNGRPIPRARVAIIPTSPPARPRLSTTTNSTGGFELRDVPPGSYFVQASRPGYLELQHGQRRPNERGVAVDVRDGGTVSGIDVALPRGSVLAGRISDDRGEPYQDIAVTAWQLQYREGKRMPFPAGIVRTDDRGHYRFGNLLPGAYQLSASSGETWRNAKNETLGFATTYYSGTDSGEPITVSLDVAQQRVDLDIRLMASRTARISGSVVAASGTPMAGEAVTLSQSIPGTSAVIAGSAISTRAGADGTFEIKDVAPGSYLIRAGTRNDVAMERLIVAGDVANLVLVPTSGSPVTGNVVTDEGVTPPFPASGVRLNLVSDSDRVKPTVRVPAINDDWTIRLQNVGGPFLFRIQGLPASWMLDAVRLGDRDITDVPYDVPTGGKPIAGLQIVITRDVGKIDGTVSDAGGKPASDATIVAFAENDEHWIFGSRYVRSARPAADGRYSITGLPAGAYLVVARQALADGEWETREFLDSVRSSAARIDVERGHGGTVHLTLPQ